jgi:hypothetical protein
LENTLLTERFALSSESLFPDSLYQAPRASLRASRHNHIVLRADPPGSTLTRAPPVAHHETVEAPLLPEHPGEEPLVLGAVGPFSLLYAFIIA